MDHWTMDAGLVVVLEVMLRVALGLRFLGSGISNVRRWPHAVGTAKVVFAGGTRFFALMAVAFMVLGGFGVAVGFQTRVAALMIVLFIIPTFLVLRNHLQTYPKMLAEVLGSLPENGPMDEARRLGRAAIHSSETSWQANLIFLLLALYFMIRGSVAFGIDNLLG